MLVTLGLAACSSSLVDPVSTLPTQTLNLYDTPARTATAELSLANVLPTPTPHIHTVVEGDTLFEIAVENGVTVDMLMLANPAVDPRVLTPGTQLVIPAPNSTVVPAIPSPTPAAVLARAVKCYATTAGELWCFLPVENANAFSLENIVGIVQLLDANGHVLASVEAVPPLNLLPAGNSMPLVSYLQEVPQDWVSARGQVFSAYPVAQESDYYIGAVIQQTEIDASETGLAARVHGLVQVSGDLPAGVVWVLAVAYDADGDVVGVYRWERQDSDEFSFWVYSLGPEIAEVELLVEARP